VYNFNDGEYMKEVVENCNSLLHIRVEPYTIYKNWAQWTIYSLVTTALFYKQLGKLAYLCFNLTQLIKTFTDSPVVIF